jgi:hypothetical protein
LRWLYFLCYFLKSASLISPRQIDIDLAIHSASLPVDNKELSRALWLRIAEHLIKEGEWPKRYSLGDQSLLLLFTLAHFLGGFCGFLKDRLHWCLRILFPYFQILATLIHLKSFYFVLLAKRNRRLTFTRSLYAALCGRVSSASMLLKKAWRRLQRVHNF